MIMINLNSVKRVHFIGIAGVGMQAIANIFIDKGYSVSGSDMKATAVTENFAARGARICIGQRAENLGDAEVVVISSAIRETNEELKAAREQGIPVIHRADALVHIMSWGKAIAVAGAHGKTTTSSMLGQVFYENNTDPTLVIGGEVDYLHSNSVLGHGRYVIAEADESDGSFLKESPYIAVVTNIDADHMDYYGSIENVVAAFKQFIQLLDKEEGAAVLCVENEHIRNLLPTLERRCITYGIEHEADYQATNVFYHDGLLTFTVLHGGAALGDVTLAVPGRHNILNALATIATALYCGLAFTDIVTALSHFHGARRRFQTKGHVNGVWVVDDYAHHPTEINATLTAARDMGTHRVVCLFQPHRYTRTKLLAKEYGRSFVCADKLIITDVYSAGEDPIPGVSGRLIVDMVQKLSHQDVLYIPTKEAVLAYLEEHAQPQDLVITMGAGDIYTVGEQYVAAAGKKVQW
ncbi:UDP-N-acetylmuramate--L-alanine ligase [Megasphaera vaginalis (ex Srinivasan et al. 2021)]|uniref:UDP-N-acetylmuramate--L-alanine ligase n=2 Tax=Megasphaera vaginalis (ex Srinivasan et al. 2021) TaxID=1111454 RepID=U7UFH1_9FIRM|nr:UDP-N-acetylmuramate--L-alanine ligase [Megasphaera vaginalis (ex Srinivasan et al. 2021)]